MKISQKDFELLSNTDTDQLVDDIWSMSTSAKTLDTMSSLSHKVAVLTQFHDLASTSLRRAIARAFNDLESLINKQSKDEVFPDEVIEQTKQALKDALKGTIHYPTTHVPRRVLTTVTHYVIQLVPAFQPHPEFKVTYYAGYMKPPLFEPERTHEVEAAAHWADKDEAQNVASNLLNTMSCVWKVVEA